MIHDLFIIGGGINGCGIARDASGGDDWWLSPGEPHCADCHLAPFVESEGGGYFPLDQPKPLFLPELPRTNLVHRALRLFQISFALSPSGRPLSGQTTGPG